MKPVMIDVVTLAPTVFTHCQHCELTFQEMGIGERLRRQEAAEALPDDLARDYQALSDWVHGLLQRHGPQVRVKVVDAASIEGFIASVRHRLGRYPAVIVDGERHVRSDYDSLDRLVDHRVAARAAGAPAAVAKLERRG
jgi:hypothetical protein